MKIFSYVRVSTAKQDINRQIDNIKAVYPNTIQYADHFTGKTVDRPQFNELKKAVNKAVNSHEEITIVFDSVSRMSRNADEGTAQYFEWYNMGVNLVFLNERYIDTDSYKKAINQAVTTTTTNDGTAASELIEAIMKAISKFMIEKVKDDIYRAFEQAQKEVDDLAKRTSDGMRSKGAGEKIRKARQGNRFTTVHELETRIHILKNLKAFGGNDTLVAIADKKSVDTSIATLNRYKKHIEEDMETATKEELIERYTAEIKRRNNNE